MGGGGKESQAAAARAAGGGEGLLKAGSLSLWLSRVLEAWSVGSSGDVMVQTETRGTIVGAIAVGIDEQEREGQRLEGRKE